MKTRIYRIFLPSAAILALGAMSSCISDSSVEGGVVLPAIEIAAPADGSMPEVNFNYGEEAVITPQIRYTGSKNLTYEWSIATFDNNVKGEFTPAGNVETFRYHFPKGGSYVAHLNVTDGTIGEAVEYRVNINRTFEVGYIVIANDASGKGNLTFIKNRTPEEIEAGTPSLIMEHSLEKTNTNLAPEKLIGVQTLIISWPPPGVTRIIVSTETKCHFLDPNTFVTAASIDYNSVIPGFKAQQFLGGAANVRAYDPVSRRFITAHGNQMFGYEENAFIGHGPDVVYYGTYVMWGTSNYDNYYINREPLEFTTNYYDYGTGKTVWHSTLDITENDILGLDLPADMLPLFNNEDLVAAFMGMPLPTAYGTEFYPCQVITRNKTTGDFFTTTLTGFDGYTPIQILSRNSIVTNPNSAIPATEGNIVPSVKYKRTYYANGNRVYAMLYEADTYSLPEKNQFCIEFPSDEEVTYMGEDGNADRLIIATCNKNSGRGSVYFYKTADVRTNNPNPDPDEVFKNCSDRITQICFKPRVAN